MRPITCLQILIRVELTSDFVTANSQLFDILTQPVSPVPSAEILMPFNVSNQLPSQPLPAILTFIGSPVPLRQFGVHHEILLTTEWIFPILHPSHASFHLYVLWLNKTWWTTDLPHILPFVLEQFRIVWYIFRRLITKQHYCHAPWQLLHALLGKQCME